MSAWETVTLREVAESLDYGVTAPATWEPKGSKFLRITDIRNGSVDWNQVPWCESNDRGINGSHLRPGDIVFARTGSTGNSLLIRDCPEGAVFASYLIRVRLNNSVDPSYMSHFLRTPDYWSQIASKSRGAIQSGVNASTLGGLEFPLPPVDEQRRIAELLDRSDALHAKRREALSELDELTQSIFLDMFGDPITNLMGWPRTTLVEVLAMPLRNGVSPSRGGKFQAKVLTLSAITGNEFEASALKLGDFETAPPPTKIVNDSDLLICRGNGNIDLVGRAHFPKTNLPDVLFPDTVIAARTSASQVSPIFMEIVWKSKAVRRQIEAVARTTNGTFKVNQKALEGISFFLPHLPIQQEFAERVQAIGRVKASHCAHLAELDALFASLQDRAFRGES